MLYCAVCVVMLPTDELPVPEINGLLMGVFRSSKVTDDVICGSKLAEGMDPRRVEHVGTVEQAVGKLRAMLQPKDVVLVKGSRAGEMERIVDTLRTADRTAS